MWNPLHTIHSPLPSGQPVGGFGVWGLQHSELQRTLPGCPVAEYFRLEGLFVLTEGTGSSCRTLSTGGAQGFLRVGVGGGARASEFGAGACAGTWGPPPPG